MIARAEQGITGSGLNCHVCSGTSNLCTNSTDQGTLIDCGEGVVTCLIATGNLILQSGIWDGSRGRKQSVPSQENEIL